MRKSILTKVIIVSLSLPLVVSLFALSADTAAKKVLKVWDTFSEEASTVIVEEMIKRFEEKHPDFIVERMTSSLEDMRKTIKMALGSGTGPDIFYYDVGPSFGEVLVRAGMVEFLTDAYRERGWDKRVSSGPRDNVTLDGKIYAIPNEVEMYTNWYNVGLFNRLGLNVPTTWEDYIANCQKMADNDIVSWPWGDRKGIWYSWTQAPFFEAVAGGRMVIKAIRGEVPWNSPEFVEAVEVMKEFYQKGYFNQDFSALDFPEVQMMFYTEEAGMLTAGTWLNPILRADKGAGAFDFDLDFFFTPPYKPGIDATTPGLIGSAWFLSAASEHKKEALDFLEDTISDETAALSLKVGYLPALNLSESFIAGLGLDPITSKIVESAPKLHVGAFNCFLPGSVNEYLFQNAPRVFRGEISAKELQDKFQELYQEYLESR